jgi:hypothetical protein
VDQWRRIYYTARKKDGLVGGKRQPVTLGTTNDELANRIAELGQMVNGLYYFIDSMVESGERCPKKSKGCINNCAKCWATWLDGFNEKAGVK